KNVTFPQAFEEDYHLLAWSPNGRYLATTDSGQVGIWDSVRKEQLRVLYRGQVAFRVENLAWPSDGQQIVLINGSNELVHLTW
ncbi:MAG: WD40 repeat domain-containing protein, partial [Ktedonobacteraceae bacterium]|nr:WD40 repeat domain-containing protein [Ktedonobacteraceae bacterium]